MTCGGQNAVICRELPGKLEFASITHRCKRWDCPECSRIKASAVRSKIDQFAAGKQLYLLTLTLFHTGDPQQAYYNISDAWNRLRTYVVKYYGKFSYIRILEPHKVGGWPHLHILTDLWFADRRFAEHLVGWGFGWNAECVRVENSGAKGYVTKYLTKPWTSVDGAIYRRNAKSRIVSSSNSLRLPPSSLPQWFEVYKDRDIDKLLSRMEKMLKTMRSVNVKDISCQYAYKSLSFSCCSVLPDKTEVEAELWQDIDHRSYDLLMIDKNFKWIETRWPGTRVPNF
jgi:hypothetical protein